MPAENHVTLSRARAALVVASVACLAYFVVYFQGERWQPTVDLAWLLAVCLWIAAFWRTEVSTVPRIRHFWWFYALYAAVLLPFGTNWRWAMAADNLGWPLGGMTLAEMGPFKSFLSVNGADNFGYLQMTLHNLFMHLVEPTLFWHRAGKITVAVIAMAAVYTFFARVVSRPFGLLVAGCSASCSVWIVYTYASVPFMDGIATGYATMAIGLWIAREPASRRAWLALGWVGGFMLFLTPNGWYLAVCVWAWLGALLLWRRWGFANAVIAASTALVTGLPILLQWASGQGAQLFSLVDNPEWTREMLWRFSREAAFIPFESAIQGAGAFGPQLPQGFRWLFIPGILLTPIFGRRFPGARGIFCLYAAQVIALVLSQGPYAYVSVKRALLLIPMATYFVFLPFHRYVRALPAVLVLIAVWASLGIYDVVARMQPGRTGYTLVDGLIEADQRFRGSKVCVYLTKDQFARELDPTDPVNRLYNLAPHMHRVVDPTDPACSEMLCYSPQIDEVSLETLGYREIPMQNSVELRCGRREG